MKPVRTFRIGSTAFFSGLDGFNPKDQDELNIVDEWYVRCNSSALRLELHGKDIFFFRNMDKEGFIQDALKSKVPMKVGKFLVPEFAEYLKMEIADLKRLKPLIENIDDKHSYEGIIYRAYMENGSWTLTDEQKQEAFRDYLSKR